MTKRTYTIKGGSIKEVSDVLQSMTNEVGSPAAIITGAAIKDGFCNYTYEITSGIGIGDSHSVKGSGIVKDDMLEAFSAFNVHMAAIDDVYKHKGVEIIDIDDYHSHELTLLYTVTGFKIKGSKEDESIILSGHKYSSSAGGRIEFSTPKIALDNLSSYKWYNELKTAAEAARKEVMLYKNGKYTPVEEDEDDKPNPKQTRIGFDKSADDDDDSMDDFEGAKL